MLHGASLGACLNSSHDWESSARVSRASFVFFAPFWTLRLQARGTRPIGRGSGASVIAIAQARLLGPSFCCFVIHPNTLQARAVAGVDAPPSAHHRSSSSALRSMPPNNRERAPDGLHGQATLVKAMSSEERCMEEPAKAASDSDAQRVSSGLFGTIHLSTLPMHASCSLLWLPE